MVAVVVVDMVGLVICPTLALFVCNEGLVKWAGIFGFLFGAEVLSFCFNV